MDGELPNGTLEGIVTSALSRIAVFTRPVEFVILITRIVLIAILHKFG